VASPAGGDKAGDSDGIRMRWGLGSGVKIQGACAVGWRPFPFFMPTPVRAMSSLDSLLSELDLVPAVLLELGPEDVLGLAGMLKGVVLATTAMFLDGGGGRGRSR
jgi:hypothetical protein